MYLFHIKIVVVVGTVKTWIKALPTTDWCLYSTHCPPAPRVFAGGNYRSVPRPSTIGRQYRLCIRLSTPVSPALSTQVSRSMPPEFVHQFLYPVSEISIVRHIRFNFVDGMDHR